jgi:hypothetical protein
MIKALYRSFVFASFCLSVIGCAMWRTMLPEISIDEPLHQFLQAETYQADALVRAALARAQTVIGDRGTVAVRSLSLALDCSAAQCALKYLIVSIAANPLRKPVVILDADDEFVSVDTDFFIDLLEGSVQTISHRSRWLSVDLPMWDDLPIGLTEAQDAFVNYAQQKLAERYPRYRIHISLTRHGWIAELHYTDPENQFAPADETLEIAFERKP